MTIQGSVLKQVGFVATLENVQGLEAPRGEVRVPNSGAESGFLLHWSVHSPLTIRITAAKDVSPVGFSAAGTEH